MSYGRTAPEGIPQHIWDEAIDLWLNLSTADSNDIKTIADRLMDVYLPIAAVPLAASGQCLAIAQEAFNAWVEKPHNKRWSKRLDGTPISNDLVVTMAVWFGAHGVLKYAQELPKE